MQITYFPFVYWYLHFTVLRITSRRVTSALLKTLYFTRLHQDDHLRIKSALAFVEFQKS